MGPVCLDGAAGHDRHRLRPVEVANLLPGQVREVEDCHRVAVSYRARRLTASRPRPISVTMSFQPPEQFNIADYFLDARVREGRSEEHPSDVQSQPNLVCRLLLETQNDYHPAP